MSLGRFKVGSMRILFLAYRDPMNPYIGGGDIYINEIAKGFAKRGHKVTFIASRFPGSTKEQFIDGLHIIRLGNRFNLTWKIFLLYFGQLRGKYDIVIEEIVGGPRFPFFAGVYMKESFIGILQQRHEHIFLHEFPFPIGNLLSLAEPLFGLLYKRRPLLVNSVGTKNDLRKIGFSEDKIWVAHPGLSQLFFSVEERGLEDRRFQVVCIAKPRRYKLIHHAILAMREVCKVIPECKLIVVGRTSDVDAKYEQSLHTLAREQGLPDNVCFRRDMSEDEKIRLLSSSRVLVLPSAVEGFGIVVIEANACGTPAVVSDRVPKDAAIDGHNATVFKCGDVKALSKGILTLMTDDRLWGAMSANSMRWARQFTWDRSINKLLDVVEGIKQRPRS